MTISPSLLALLETESTEIEQNELLDEVDPTSELSDEDIRLALLKRISYSSLAEFRICERRYFLDKLTTGERESSVDTAFGSALGQGVQTLWLTDNVGKAKLACFTGWDTGFYEEKPSANKSIAYVLRAFEAYLPVYNILSQMYEVAEINGKKAIEYSLAIEFPGGFVYRSYVDIILRSKATDVLTLVELKTTGTTWAHEAQYKNSDQGTSYGLPIDQMIGEESNLWITYQPFYTKLKEWKQYEFPKQLMDKARWLKTTMQDVADISRAIESGYWPMRGSACMSFGRPCRYFETCQMSDQSLVASPEALRKKLRKELKIDYNFVIPVATVIEGYLS